MTYTTVTLDLTLLRHSSHSVGCFLWDLHSAGVLLFLVVVRFRSSFEIETHTIFVWQES